MTQACHCGCSTGIGAVGAVINPPSLTALRYRVGSYASFTESMLARLSTLAIAVPSPYGDGVDLHRPLKGLTTRAPDDPSIALLDAFAVIGDVLTFYQERIANEGYLPTATERRSIQELGNLIGYRLRPGVAASVHLAFTVAADFKGVVPKGTRAQSVPGAGDLPQFFETSDDLDARFEWNALKPRLTRPQMVSPADPRFTEVTAADSLDTVYLAGTSTNLKANDPMLFVLGEEEGRQTMRRIEAVEAQEDEKRTQVVFGLPTTAGTFTLLELYAKKARQLFPGSDLAAEVAGIIEDHIADDENTAVVPPSAAETLAALTEKQALAESRHFTRLATLIRHAAAILARGPGAGSLGQKPSRPQISPVAELLALTSRLSRPASVQPANAIRLGRSIATSFSGRSDIAPRLLGAFKPAAAPLLYRAWTRIVKPADRLEAHALRVRAGLFASTYPGRPIIEKDDSTGKSTTSFEPLDLREAWSSIFPSSSEPPSAVALDATYDRIRPGSWVAIDRPEVNSDHEPTGERVVTYHRVEETTVFTMDTDTGFAAKVTLLTLKPQWLADVRQHDKDTGNNHLGAIVGAVATLRDTIVHAQSEPLAFAEEPLDADVGGDTIDLPEALDGLEAGRWLIVSGERTDVPGVSGVTAAELVMLAGVAQIRDEPPGKDGGSGGSSGSDEGDDDEVPVVSAAPGKLHTRLSFATPLAYTYDAATVTIHGNVASATNGQTVGEVLGDGDGSAAFQSLALRQAPLTFVSAPTAEGAASTLVARVNDIAWHETGSLAAAGPRERVFVTRTDEAGKTTLVFGNGVHGARLPTGTANIKATYRYGIGKGGNVKANQISQLATHPLGLHGVINPIAASGGADRDGVEAGRRNAPLALMALDRLVSVKDYADFARSFAGIGKASAARLSDGRRQLVHVTVAGVDDIPILETSDLYRNLLGAIEALGDPHLPVQLCVRKIKLLVISAAVALLPDYAFEFVEPKIRRALLGHFGFEQRDLGQAAFQSEAVAVIQGIEGVAHVAIQHFDSIAEDISAEELEKLAGSLGLRPYVTARGARLNPAIAPAASDDPCERVLPAELVYLTPAIPDTLILTEAGR
ncbi:putative baseplate assembly protein [Inquilinus limosus]|uniref:putative baseplate assembly protein n=1 Tax=Inquilinus limosus TaxID=171674 RepID=UPI003F18A29F